MHFPTALATLAAAATGASAAAMSAWDPENAIWNSGVPSNYSAGMMDAYVTASSNGSAVCINGLIPVTASTTMNKHLNLTLPANQTVVTEIFVEMLQAGSNLIDTIVGKNANISGTYNISAQLCYPRSTGINASSVQFLTHGVGFAKNYWDVAPGYSYVDVAAANGYTTFSYDRLGVGLSSHPDPIQVVQAPLEVSIAHQLVQMLRNGSVASTSFSHVVGTGHSFGSFITQALTKSYPSDLDAAVLTGFSLSMTGLPTFLTSLDLSIAAINDALRFSGLPTGYLVANNYIGNQFAFFRAQGFPPSNLAIADATKQTVTLGELFTLAAVTGNTTYTGPVDVVDGANDWPFCQGNCSYPMDLAAAAKALYPMTRNFTSYLAPNCGHGLNLHYAATAAYEQIQAFVMGNGL
ncbi:hypothetical protein MBLNU459_g0196t1 [Dothideomycetes sp. NU459]